MPVLPQGHAVVPLWGAVLPSVSVQQQWESFILPRHGNTEDAPKSQRKGGAKGTDVYVMIPPKPFQIGPPLNSMAFLRLKSTEKKRKEASSSIGFEGHQIVLYLVMKCLKYSEHTISPQKHCHQSPKQLRDKYALTTVFPNSGI